MFNDNDIKCRCGCDYIVKDENQIALMTRIFETCQELYSIEPTITSWCRCEEHNAAVGGVPNSFHVQGIATDWVADGLTVDEMVEIAEGCGADGIGAYYGDGFCHTDTRGYEARW